MTEEQSVTPEKKKRVNSKRKGSGFEGHLAKMLNVVLHPLKFRRSQSSGAILGGVNVKFAEHFSDDAKALFIGDVVPTNAADVLRDEGWSLRFTLECKFYKNADTIDNLFGNTKIRGWMNQAVDDAKKINKTPLLIFKFNRTETFCATVHNALAQHPSTATRSMVLKFSDGFEMIVFLLSEAIKDINWWKSSNVIIAEEQPSGSLTDPTVSKMAFDAIMSDRPGYFTENVTHSSTDIQ